MQLRKGVSTGAVAGVIVIILVVAAVGYYYISTPGTTTTSVVTSTVTSTASPTATTTAAGNTVTVMAISGFSDGFFNATARDFLARRRPRGRLWPPGPKTQAVSEEP